MRYHRVSFQRSRGLSAWEALAFLIMIGGYFYIGLNLYSPVFQRWQIYDILETTMAEKESLESTTAGIKSRINKRMSVNGIYGVTAQDFKIQKTDQKIRLTFDKPLEVTMPFGINVVVNVRKEIEVDRPK